jgi:hypothetical protein
MCIRRFLSFLLNWISEPQKERNTAKKEHVFIHHFDSTNFLSSYNQIRTSEYTFQPDLLANASTVSDRNNCEMFS